ncbi:MAG: type IV secretion system DNA-binding domain-containing protein [bacterium]|nr:type IV secretion system DNA-binding domain-containing protein [bacterium]
MTGILVTLPAAETNLISTGTAIVATIGGVLVFAVIVAAGLWIFRKIMISSGRLPSAFQRVVLLVTMPKEHMELEEQTDTQRRDVKELMGVAESLYANLGGLVRQQRWWSRLLFGRQDHIALEIVANQGLISFYVVVPYRFQQFVEQQIHAQYPEAQVEEEKDYNLFTPNSAIRGTYLKLIKRQIFPIRTYLKLESDPMSSLTNVLSKIGEGEGASIQLLIRPASKGWQSSGHKYARQVIEGKEGSGVMRDVMKSAFPSQSRTQLDQEKERSYRMSPLEEERIKAVGEKASKLGFETNIRIVVSAANSGQADLYLDNIVNTFSQYTQQEVGNGFRKSRFASRDRFIHDFIYRNFRDRNRVILNTEELTSVFHFPAPGTETPNIRWMAAKRSAPPVNLPKEGIVIGESTYRGRKEMVRIKTDDRRRHCYVIGKSGTGKSVLITNMAIQDIKNGEGICVIDPHGDLIDDILPHVPPERRDDVIIFNPSDMERPIGLNMLEADTPEEMDFAVQEMIAIFYKLFPPEMIGPMFEHNMRNVMLTLMANREQPGTIVEIPRMFTDPVFQKSKLQHVSDPIVRAFWEKEMAKTSDFHKSEMLGYLISKVGRFVENEMMRNIIGQSRSGLNFKKVMNERKILLVNLSKGKTGEVNSSLLGLIIVSKLQMAALARAHLPADQRPDFYLYIDEFQNFITDSIATILSEARKYRLDLTIAHQYIGQLVQNQDAKIRDAVLGNVGTIIAFKIGVEDSETVAKIFAPVFNQFDATNIEKYNAYVKLLIDNQSSRAFNIQTMAPLPGDPALAERLRQLSRMVYGRERSSVEAEIAERGQLGSGAPSNELGTETKL